MPTTQPLDTPLDRKDAARIIVRDPIYLDRSLQLWITRPDADATSIVLKRSASENEHFTRERPSYVHWRYEPPTRRLPGKSTAVLISAAGDGKSIDFIEETRRTTVTAIRTRYLWTDAFSWNECVVVANDAGASVFERTDQGWTEKPSPKIADENIPPRPGAGVGGGRIAGLRPGRSAAPGQQIGGAICRRRLVALRRRSPLAGEFHASDLAVGWECAADHSRQRRERRV